MARTKGASQVRGVRLPKQTRRPRKRVEEPQSHGKQPSQGATARAQRRAPQVQAPLSEVNELANAILQGMSRAVQEGFQAAMSAGQFEAARPDQPMPATEGEGAITHSGVADPATGGVAESVDVASFRGSATQVPPVVAHSRMGLPCEAQVSTLASTVTSELNMTPTSLISGVPDSVKVKIWEGRFIDLSVLIYKSDNTVSLNFAPGEEGVPGMVMTQRPSRTIKSIPEWDRAFAKFHAIYIRRHPRVGEALIAHQQQVRKIAQGQGDWQGYDQDFRRGVADGTIGWGQMNPGLVLDAMLFANRGPASTVNITQQGAPSFDRRGINGTLPVGSCWAFHRRNTCNRRPCTFSHRCPKCGGAHSRLVCGSPKDSAVQRKTIGPRS